MMGFDRICAEANELRISLGELRLELRESL